MEIGAVILLDRYGQMVLLYSTILVHIITLFYRLMFLFYHTNINIYLQ